VFHQGTGEPQRLAVGSGFVVWTEYGTGASDGTVMKAELPNGTPEPLAVGQSYPSAITIAGQDAVWRAGSSIKSAPLAGGAATTLVDDAGCEGIAVDGDTIVWTDSGLFETGTVFKAPLGGGSSSILAEGGQSFGIDAAGGTVFWAALTDSTVRSVPITGGAATDIAVADGSPDEVVVNGTHVYWSVEAGEDTGVWRAPTTGGAAQQIAVEFGYVSGLAVADDMVYYFWWNGIGAIRQVAPAGGDPFEVMPIPEFQKPPPDEVGQMAVDATHVYWIDGDHDAVYRFER